MHKEDWCKSPRLCNDHPTQHAPDCLVGELDEAAKSSRCSNLLELVLDLDFRATHHYHIDWSEVPADEYLAHKILLEERKRKEREEQEAAKLQRG